MKFQKGFIAVGFASLLSIGAVFALASSKNFKSLSSVGVRASQTEVDFSSKDITRRVYFYVDGSWGDWNDTHVLHYTLDGSNWSWTGNASEFYGGYYQGLFFVDITGAGVGDEITVQVKNTKSDSSYCYTTNVVLPALGDKSCDVIHVESGSSGSNRAASIGFPGASISQVASFLNFMSTCDDSFAFGYKFQRATDIYQGYIENPDQ